MSYPKLLMSLLFTCSSAASAYEMPTHAFMTKNAFDRSRAWAIGTHRRCW